MPNTRRLGWSQPVKSWTRQIFYMRGRVCSGMVSFEGVRVRGISYMATGLDSFGFSLCFLSSFAFVYIASLSGEGCAAAYVL